MRPQLALTFVLGTVFIDMIGFGIIMPVLPGLLIELTGDSLGGASIWGGWLLFSYAILQFVFAPVLGNLSDRYGRRPILLIALFVYAINYLLMGFASTIFWLFVGRILTGISGSTYTIANAYIADVSKPEERAQNFGLVGMALGLGFIFGPVIGGFLGEYGTRVPFIAASVLAICNMIYGYFVLPETLAKENRRNFDVKRANPVGALMQLRKLPVLAGLSIAVLLFQIGHHVYPATWSFYVIEKFSWGKSEVGYSLGFVGLLMAIVQGGLIRIVIPRIGEYRAAVFGFSAMTIAYIGLGTASSGVEIYAWCVVSALGGFAMPAIQGIMSNQVPQNQQGELQGIIASLGSLGAIFGPLLMTQLFAHFTEPDNYYFPGAPFVAAGVLTIFAGFAVVRGFRILSASQTS